MEHRILGKDLQVSKIGFGCMGLSHAYGKPVEKKEGIRLLREAVEMGYTLNETDLRSLNTRSYNGMIELIYTQR